MAGTSRQRRRRRPSGRRRRPARRGRLSAAQGVFLAACAGLAGLAFVAGLPLGAYLKRLDGIVTERFEGRLFRVPSRVYSAPTILYPGLDLEEVGLEEVLERLSYTEAAPEGGFLPPGRYHRSRRGFRIHLRAFEHPRRPEPARDILLELDGTSIRRIRELPDGPELAAVMLEPEAVGAYYGPRRVQRELVQLSDVPRHLIDAVLAIEDRRFEQHVGIDPVRIVGALIANLRAGSITQGGSTLTQQLVKNFFLTPERTYRRKLNEALMAVIVEVRYPKDAILEAYLNEIYLGQRGPTEIRGVGEAARVFFGKSVRDLTVAESALLAGIIHSPNATSPYRNPEAARRRRDLVLDQMRRQGRIDEETALRAKGRPLELARVTREEGHTRYFLDALQGQLPEIYDEQTLTSDGLRIYSTLDPRLQRIAHQAVREGLAELEKRHPRLRIGDPRRNLQACLVALRPQTGEVVALVGGRDYGQSQYNRCTSARRQPGSVFKPIVYAAALEPGEEGPTITLASFIDDSPLTVRTKGSRPWQPKNFDRQFHGRVPVRTAIEKSMNVAAARLGQEVGIGRVRDMARRLGIASPLPAVPSLALGAASLPPIEIARAYATLANGGIRPELRFFEDVVDQRGRTVERREIAFERVLDPGTAFLVTSLLQGVVERGTGAGIRRAGIRGPIAGKTGTSNDTRDAWFAGYTPDLVVVVWVGFDEPRPMGLTGGRAALPIWIRFLQGATGGRVEGEFLAPPSVVALAIDPASGARALPGCPSRRREFFLPGTEPRHTCPGFWGGPHVIASREPGAPAARSAGPQQVEPRPPRPDRPRVQRPARDAERVYRRVLEWFRRQAQGR